VPRNRIDSRILSWIRGDNIMPLKRGGADSPNNMQWQTSGDAKAKDRVE
jgi:hypothetical protein